MAKKRKTKNKGKNWRAPKNAKAYFDPHYDDDFKAAHPILYWLTVVAIIVMVMVGPTLYIILCSAIQPTVALFEGVFWFMGFLSSFGISIGLCNLFMIIHKQYLGHYVTLWSFAIGIVGSVIGLFFLWLI
ncbi:MAG: hypothetical protein E7667_00010 [Ruminococcaceae bacterium]|nr:hypothetical protein [Oscillospiraceae bacterium]